VSAGLGSAADAVEVLQQVVRRELDLLVAPLGGAVDARDQPAAVDPAEVAVDERVARLVASDAPAVSPRNHPPYSSQLWFSRYAFSASALGWTSPQSLRSTYCRASISSRALATAVSFTS
jgi:hypothetical protein